MAASATRILRTLASASKAPRLGRSALSTAVGGNRSVASSTLPTSFQINDVAVTAAAGRGAPGRRSMATVCAGEALARLASDHPHQEIIRYEHKNVKWTLKHVDYYADALATGLVDAGLKPGDKVLSWLPLHFAEQVRIIGFYSPNIYRFRLFFYLLTRGNINTKTAHTSICLLEGRHGALSARS